jgi:RNA polymerase sigma-32 factor
LAKKTAPTKKTSGKANSKAASKSKVVSAEIVDSDTGNSFAEIQADSKAPLNSAKNRAIATTDPITSYLAEIRRYPLLSREEEFELAKRYFDSKDPLAAQALVTANLRFVVKVAAEYSKFGARMIDLVQEGNMGLMHAVRDYNPYKGVRLITYAVWWIRGYIQEYLMKQFSMVKIGTTQNQKKLFYQLQREKDALDLLGEKPDIKTIAAKMGIPEEEVEIMSQRMAGRDISLDRPIGDENSATLGDMQTSTGEDLVESIGRREEIQRLSHKIEELRPELNEREIILLEERLLHDNPLTLQEIGEKYGITREAVRQAEARLMKKIKEKFES